MKTEKIYQGDCIEVMKDFPDESIDCVVTSPPYWGLRDYGTAEWEGGDENCDHKGKVVRTAAPGSSIQAVNKGANFVSSGDCKCGAIRKDSQLGLEETPEEFVANLVKVFSEVKRVLKKEGSVWLNLGDSYARTPSSQVSQKGMCESKNDDKKYEYSHKKDYGSIIKPKDLVGIPWRVALALQSDGWYLRQDIIWHKPNPMPESVKDRPTSAHEKIYLFAKNKKYYYDADAIRVPQKQDSIARAGRNYWDTNKVETGNYSIPNIESAKKLNQKVLDTVAEGKIPMANKRNVWTVTTKPFRGAHFAVFPQDLIEPCIKAGSSEHGCCSKCGNPYIRITKKGDYNLKHQIASGGDKDGKYYGKSKKDYSSAKAQDASETKKRILESMKEVIQVGWEATCKCNAGIKKSVILDPFGGSGTTGLVANNLGRDAILIELNKEYVEIAKKRLGEDLGLFSEVKDG